MPTRRNDLFTAALALAMLVVGACTSPTAPRSPAAPTPVAPTAPAARVEIRDLNTDVASIAASISGAGRTEAIVLGNVALLALNVGGEPPGGFTSAPGATAPGAAPGTAPGVTATPGTTPPGVTTAPTPGVAGAPGGAPGVAVARPGGGITPGPVVPGGTPGSTTGTPGTTPAPAGFGGATAPLNVNNDLQGRVATAINERFPFVAEVRFTGTGAQSDTLSRILADVRAGQPVTKRLPELAALAAVMQPTSNLLKPMPGGPPQSGTTGTPAGTTTPSPTTVPGTTAPGTTSPGTTAPASPKGSP